MIHHSSSWPQARVPIEAQFAQLFRRRDWQRRGAQYMQALLTSPGARRNGVQLAAAVAGATPRAFQRFLSDSPWAYRQIIDGLCATLGPLLQSEQGLWVLKDIAFAKQGAHSVGVAQQTSGVRGASQNCQVGLFLAYASSQASAFVDMQLYMPRTWAEDSVRRRQAGVPDTVQYQSKTDLALKLLHDAHTRGQLMSSWVTGASEVGQDAAFRDVLDVDGWWYLLEVPGSLSVFTETLESRTLPAMSFGAYRRRGPGPFLPCTPHAHRIRDLAVRLPLLGWKNVASSSGMVQWTALRIWDERERQPGREQWLVLCRNRDGGGRRYYLSNAPMTMPIETLVGISIAAADATIALAQAQIVIGLDAFEVRSWQGWYHHMSLCLLAGAFFDAAPAPGVGMPDIGVNASLLDG